jgi:hypothetical protein
MAGWQWVILKDGISLGLCRDLVSSHGWQPGKPSETGGLHFEQTADLFCHWCIYSVNLSAV